MLLRAFSSLGSVSALAGSSSEVTAPSFFILPSKNSGFQLVPWVKPTATIMARARESFIVFFSDIAGFPWGLARFGLLVPSVARDQVGSNGKFGAKVHNPGQNSQTFSVLNLARKAATPATISSSGSLPIAL